MNENLADDHHLCSYMMVDILETKDSMKEPDGEQGSPTSTPLWNACIVLQDYAVPERMDIMRKTVQLSRKHQRLYMIDLFMAGTTLPWID